MALMKATKVKATELLLKDSMAFRVLSNIWSSFVVQKVEENQRNLSKLYSDIASKCKQS